MFTEYFISHAYLQNQIPFSEANIPLTVLFLILLGLILLTTKLNKQSSINPEEYFRSETSDALRGVAILCLIFGHFASLLCPSDEYFFGFAGRWAIIIFLFISGVVLTKKYSLSNLPKNFLYRRISKLMPSVCVAMTFFIILDYVLLGKIYSPLFIILNFIGILSSSSADPPTWYITYLFLLYSVYFLLSKINITNIKKLFVLFIICYIVPDALMVFNSVFISDVIKNWKPYAIAFPSAVGIGLYYKQIYDNSLIIVRKNMVLYIIIMSIMLYLFINLTKPYKISMIYDLLLICSILLLTIIFDFYRFQSSFLSFLGKYSFEIYLIHMPFMVKYDFLMFRKPLILTLLLYFLLVILGSIAFKKLITQLTSILNIGQQKG